MRNIIYKSDSTLPWDTQSAFKMTSYNASVEENMVFCYIKAYIHQNDFVLCSYCFVENPDGDDNLRLFLNLNPECGNDLLQIDFGYGGISSALLKKSGNTEINYKDEITFSSFKADDEQGFYWCGEIRIPRRSVEKMFNVSLKEKSIIRLNMLQKFSNGDFSSLFGDTAHPDYLRADNMEIFVVLNY